MAKPITYTERERQLIEEARRKQGGGIPIVDAQGGVVGVANPNTVLEDPKQVEAPEGPPRNSGWPRYTPLSNPLPRDTALAREVIPEGGAITPNMSIAGITRARNAGANPDATFRGDALPALTSNTREALRDPSGKIVGMVERPAAGAAAEPPISPLVGALEKGTQDIYARARAYLDKNGGVRGLERTQNFWAAVRPGTSMDQNRVTTAPDGTKAAVERNFFDEAETQTAAERLAKDELATTRNARRSARKNLQNLNNRIRGGEAVGSAELERAQRFMAETDRPFKGSARTADSQWSFALREARNKFGQNPYEIPRPSPVSTITATEVAPFATDSQEDQMDFLSRSLRTFK